MTSCGNAFSVQVRFPVMHQMIASGLICRNWARSRLLRKLSATRLSQLSLSAQDRAGALLRQANNGSAWRLIRHSRKNKSASGTRTTHRSRLMSSDVIGTVHGSRVTNLRRTLHGRLSTVLSSRNRSYSAGPSTVTSSMRLSVQLAVRSTLALELFTFSAHCRRSRAAMPPSNRY